MTNTIQHFGLTEDQIIRKDNSFYLPVSKLAEILEVTPRNIRKLIANNGDEFLDVVEVPTFETNGGPQKGYLLSEDQVYTVCMLSRKSEKAKEFRRVLAKTIRMIRGKEFLHISEVKNLLESYTVLSKINPSKLGRYRNFRSVGLNRKEACRALNLPYATMKKADVVLGFRTKNDASHLIKYRFTKKLEAQNASNN